MIKFITSIILLLPFTISAQSLMNSTTSTIKDRTNSYELVRVDDFGYALIKYEKYNEEKVLIQDGYYLNGKPTGVWNMYNPITGDIIYTMKHDSNKSQVFLEVDDQPARVQYSKDSRKRFWKRNKVQD